MTPGVELLHGAGGQVGAAEVAGLGRGGQAPGRHGRHHPSDKVSGDPAPRPRFGFMDIIFLTICILDMLLDVLINRH